MTDGLDRAGWAMIRNHDKRHPHLARLTNYQRAVITLRERGHKPREIARILGLPCAAQVRDQLALAKRRLR